MNANARRKQICAIAALVFALLGPAVSSRAQVSAQTSPITMTVRNLTLAHDSARARTRKSSDALNNDTLRYELVFKNPTPIALKSVVFDNPLPANLIMIGGSATSSVPEKIEYS